MEEITVTDGPVLRALCEDDLPFLVRLRTDRKEVDAVYGTTLFITRRL